MKIADLYDLFKLSSGIQTDSRKIKSGEIFFALKGENFNGNAFASKAIELGASYAVIDEKEFEIKGKTILVENVLQTLQDLAHHHRNTFSIPFIAITGSNGKTTTKELIHAVLSSHFTTYTTEGNLNNHIGIPITLLKIREDAQMAVIEMGANHIGEIASYCNYVRPTHGLITNVGKAHLEGFGSEEGVGKGKGELYDHLRKYNGTAFVMWDYEYLKEMSRGIKNIITYGTNAEAGTIGHAHTNNGFLQVEIDNTFIQTQLVGEYNLPNVLAAFTIGSWFGVPGEKIKRSIENYSPSNSRSQLLEKGSNRIILDAYNANPSSMKLAIENFAQMPGDQKILMLGAMAELGEQSLAEHQAIVDLIKKHPWKHVALTGGDFMKLDHPYLKFDNSSAAAEWFKAQHFQNAQILIKGSRSSKMEKILEG